MLVRAPRPGRILLNVGPTRRARSPHRRRRLTQIGSWLPRAARDIRHARRCPARGRPVRRQRTGRACIDEGASRSGTTSTFSTAPCRPFFVTCLRGCTPTPPRRRCCTTVARFPPRSAATGDTLRIRWPPSAATASSRLVAYRGVHRVERPSSCPGPRRDRRRRARPRDVQPERASCHRRVAGVSDLRGQYAYTATAPASSVVTAPVTPPVRRIRTAPRWTGGVRSRAASRVAIRPPQHANSVGSNRRDPNRRDEAVAALGGHRDAQRVAVARTSAGTSPPSCSSVAVAASACIPQAGPRRTRSARSRREGGRSAAAARGLRRCHARPVPLVAETGRPRAGHRRACRISLALAASQTRFWVSRSTAGAATVPSGVGRRSAGSSPRRARGPASGRVRSPAETHAHPWRTRIRWR